MHVGDGYRHKNAPAGQLTSKWDRLTNRIQPRMNTLNQAARRQIDRRTLLAATGGLFLPRPARALTEVYAHDPYSGLAAGGFDVISYFLQGGPVQGDPDIEVQWADSYWRFQNVANADAFRDAPRVFAPGFGGYGVLGVAQGLPQVGDPEIFHIVNNRLYYLHSLADRAAFIKEPERYISLAEKNWPKVLDLLAP
jgi:hypothetical protein